MKKRFFGLNLVMWVFLLLFGLGLIWGIENYFPLPPEQQFIGSWVSEMPASEFHRVGGIGFAGVRVTELTSLDELIKQAGGVNAVAPTPVRGILYYQYLGSSRIHDDEALVFRKKITVQPPGPQVFGKYYLFGAAFGNNGNDLRLMYLRDNNFYDRIKVSLIFVLGVITYFILFFVQYRIFQEALEPQTA